jgi:hypothetical protein
MPRSRLMFHSTAQHGPPEIQRDAPIKTAAWRLGLLTDSDGHVHLGALVADHPCDPYTYVDLLTAVGAATDVEPDLTRVLLLDRTDHLSELRRIAECSLDNDRLRNQLVELADLSENQR